MRTVITYGTFDTLHYGHLNLLQNARAHTKADRLIVGLSSDGFNQVKKKDSLHSFSQRWNYLSMIRGVDLIIPETTWDQKRSDIKKYKADCFVMGSDWEGKFDDLNDICKVIYLPRTPQISSTELRMLVDFAGERISREDINRIYQSVQDIRDTNPVDHHVNEECDEIIEVLKQYVK